MAIPSDPILPISSAARLSGLHPQTLRKYDELGLICPARTTGGLRLYTLEEVELARRLAELTNQGNTILLAWAQLQSSS